MGNSRRASRTRRDPRVGDRIEIFWPDDGEYYPGLVASWDPSTRTHEVLYDDGDRESLYLSLETWRAPLSVVAADEAAGKALSPTPPASTSLVERPSKMQTPVSKTVLASSPAKRRRSSSTAPAPSVMPPAASPAVKRTAPPSGSVKTSPAMQRSIKRPAPDAEPLSKRPSKRAVPAAALPTSRTGTSGMSSQVSRDTKAALSISKSKPVKDFVSTRIMGTSSKKSAPSTIRSSGTVRNTKSAALSLKKSNASGGSEQHKVGSSIKRSSSSLRTKRARVRTPRASDSSVSASVKPSPTPLSSHAAYPRSKPPVTFRSAPRAQRSPASDAIGSSEPQSVLLHVPLQAPLHPGSARENPAPCDCAAAASDSNLQGKEVIALLASVSKELSDARDARTRLELRIEDACAATVRLENRLQDASDELAGARAQLAALRSAVSPPAATVRTAVADAFRAAASDAVHALVSDRPSGFHPHPNGADSRLPPRRRSAFNTMFTNSPP